ncbi:MAG: winged helix-turn-helix domain-containing protein [Humidesulfovibrio sp.]|nr:winged helix-turn-helix domain-containing protein [Humidesulfovibrio sp.]
MAIPDYQTIMLPLLKLLEDGKEWTLSALTEAIANQFKVTEEERQQLLASRSQSIISNRVSWAKCYLKQAGLIHYPQRGQYAITPKGHQVLKEAPQG